MAPTRFVADRIAAHFPGLGPAEIEPWEEATGLPSPRAPAGASRTVCVVGALGREKGIEVLIACARDALERRLPLRFVVVGHTADDDRVLAAGVFVTGPYDEDEAEALIRVQRADLAFLPSVWPETWCYALTECWRAGLAVISFDLGGQAERIRDRGVGALLAPGLAPGAINDALLAFGGDRLAPPAAWPHDPAPSRKAVPDGAG